MNKHIVSTVKIVVLVVVLALGATYALAWVGPTALPPTANVDNPINTSATPQTKVGALTLTGGLVLPTGAANGKILTSDATGNAAWQTGGGAAGYVDSAPIGSIVSFGGTTPPTGYRFCNGDSLLRTDFPDLFAAIGTTYGAADASHFSLPDLRGEFVRGEDTMGTARGVDSGRTLGSAQSQDIQSHRHLVQQYATGSGSAWTGVNNISPLGVSVQNYTNYTGGTETRPRNVALNYIIKAVNTSSLVLVNSLTGDNLGNHTATQALNMAGNNITSLGTVTANGAASTYGAFTVQGTKNTWSGINFKDAAGTTNYGTLMMSPSYSGFYNATDNNWRMYVDDMGPGSLGNVNARDYYSSLTGTWMSQQLGVGQTWQNMLGSAVGCVGVRGNGVTCTNTTGKPIEVAIYGGAAGPYNISLTVGGVVVDQMMNTSNIGQSYTVRAIVPNNTSYVVSGGGIGRWSELR